MEVLIRLGSLEITVLLSDGASVDDASLHFPLLFADLLPSRKVFAIEKRDPVFSRRRDFLIGLGQQNCAREQSKEQVTHQPLL
jgi:hypothetical protein